MGQAFRCATLQQDGRFSDHDQRLLKSMKFPQSFSKPVNIKKVNLDAFYPWISKTTTSMLGGIEDDILNNLIMNLLQQESIDPKMIQIQITPFLETKAAGFMAVLWQLLHQAQESPDGIPPIFSEIVKQNSKDQIDEDDSSYKTSPSDEHFSRRRYRSRSPHRERYRYRSSRWSRSRSRSPRRRKTRSKSPQWR